MAKKKKELSEETGTQAKKETYPIVNKRLKDILDEPRPVPPDAPVVEQPKPEPQVLPPIPPELTANDVMKMNTAERQKLNDKELSDVSLCAECKHMKKISKLTLSQVLDNKYYCEAMKKVLSDHGRGFPVVLECDLFETNG